ncbi:Ig-like domain repeat protein [Streptomyces sp. NPDC002553]|uniref:Ig-like domain repeat protein n=1 Tax=Streptomyces sp. NPDC002553 TaxID=3154417 RepID=UPI003324D91D
MSVDLLPYPRAVSVTVPADPVADIPVGDGPLVVAFGRAGRVGYVTNFDSGTVTVLDPVTRTATATVTVGSGPWGVAVNPNGSEAYVGNFDSGTVSVIDVLTNTVTATIEGISAPVGVAFSLDGAHAYVVSQDTDSLVVLDTATRAVLTTVAVGSTPYNVVISTDAAPYVYVSDFGSGTVTVVDISTYTVAATIGGFANPRGIAVSIDGQRLYVADQSGGTVSVVDTTTYTVATTIGGFAAPVAIAMGPRGALAYVTESGSGSVAAINLATHVRVATVTGLSAPRGIVVTRDSRHLYVVDNGADTVVVLNIPVPVSPDQGHTGGGDLVILSGKGFLHATQVLFGSRPADSFTVVDDFTINAVSPAGTGVVPVRVVIAGATHPLGAFFYLDTPRVRAVSPSTGPNTGGNTVTVTGIGLYTTREVRLGSTSVYPTVVSDARLVFTAPPAPPAPPGPSIRVPVVVTTLGGVGGGPTYTYLDPPTTTTLSSSHAVPVVGERATFTAAVAPVAPATGTPTGTVWFDFGDGSVPVTAVVVDGLATATHAYSGTGGSPYTVTAAYSGDDDFGPSSDTAEQTVERAPTSTSVLSSPEPSAPDGEATVTARVIVAAPGVGQPTGTVTVDFGDGSPTVVEPLVNGLATVVHTYPADDADYTISAAYSGNTDFEPSGDVSTHRVRSTIQITTTTVTSAPDPSTTWQQVSFTATVTAGSGTPTGTVLFDFGDGTAPVPVSLSQGAAVATHVYTSGSGSPYPVLATYAGDGATFSSSVGHDLQTVNPSSTSTTFSSSPDPSVTGEAVTFTATVAADAPGADVPTGTVVFDFGDGSPTVAARVIDGTAQVAHTYAAAGSYPVTAVYDDDDDFTGSSTTATHTVGQAPTIVELTAVPAPSLVGEAVTYTAVVAPVAAVTPFAPGAGAPTGTVTLDFGDGTTPVTLPLTDGAAATTHVYTSAAGSPYPVTLTYSGDADFAGSTATEDHRVRRTLTLTTVTAAPSPSVVGETVTITVTVDPAGPVAPETGPPTGTVVLDFGDGTLPVTAALTGGSATVTHAYTSRTGSPYTTTATYSGDVDFVFSTGTDLHAVDRALTTTTVTASPDPSVVGQPVTFTATVAPVAPGAGTPTGTVTFFLGDGSTPATATLTNGTATVTRAYTDRRDGPDTVTATYSGDTDFAGSSGTTVHTLNRTSTTTAVSSSPDPSVVGQPVTFTATVAPVAPGAGTPSGTVSFDFGDGTNPVTVTLVDGGAAITRPYTARTASPYTVTATYGGNISFAGSSGTDTHTVDRVSTTTSVSSSPDPSVVGQPVTFTATVAPVAPGAGTPTGTVSFDFGDGTSPVTATLANGVATVTRAYAVRTGSPYTVTATYGATVNFAGSSGTDTQTVDRVSTTTSVSSSPDPSVVGQPVTFTATVAPVAPGSGTPTGTVSFDFGDGTSPVTATLANGVATVTRAYAVRTGSPYTVTATYGATANFAGSSGTDTQTVDRVSTTTSVSSSPDPSVVGQPVTFTATVAPVAPGSGTPTGTVSFNFGDGTSPVTATLTNGVATVTRAYTVRASGVFAVTAAYIGSNGFAASSGNDTQTVNRTLSTTSVVSSPDPSNTGQKVTLTATVTAVPPGAGVPTGTVTFTLGNRSPVSVTLVNGTATTVHNPLSPGTHAVTAVYSGSTEFAGSTGTDTHTVTN